MKKEKATDLDFIEATHDGKRETAAREGYIAWRMLDVPVLYRDLMPYTTKALELYHAEKAIRRQIAEDLKLLVSPWKPIGPICQLLDLAGLEGQELAVFGLEASRALGMPAAVKPGLDPFGRLWSDYSEVKAATLAASESAARVAFDLASDLRGAAQDAGSRYVAAVNAGDSADVVAKLESDAQAAEGAWKLADAEYKRLAANPIAGALPAFEGDEPSMKLAD